MQIVSKCQSLLAVGKHKKTIINLSSAGLTKRVVKGGKCFHVGIISLESVFILLDPCHAE